ncbi:cadherin-like domain-containing protein, partial [Vibrio parahaemolyticus]|uniref:cadherin-like domain-containing protein n=1 Tax=Vibrio parahaemolyticus TaxID=670 RepID=UPI001E6524F1
GESISQTVNFTVAPVADIVADNATVVEDTPTIIKVLGNDTFEDDGKVVSLDTNNGPANGTVSVNPDGSVTYTPNDNYIGKDTFTYIVTSGGVSESTTVEVNVTPVNELCLSNRRLCRVTKAQSRSLMANWCSHRQKTSMATLRSFTP